MRGVLLFCVLRGKQDTAEGYWSLRLVLDLVAWLSIIFVLYMVYLWFIRTTSATYNCNIKYQPLLVKFGSEVIRVSTSNQPINSAHLSAPALPTVLLIQRKLVISFF